MASLLFLLHYTYPNCIAATEAERQARRESSEIVPVRSVHHLDRKLSATSRIPKRSTIIENPSGDIVQTAMSSSSFYRPVEQSRAIPQGQHQPPIQAQTAVQGQGPRIPFTPVRQQSLPPVPGDQAPSQTPAHMGQSRPPMPHTNTQIHIGDHSSQQPLQSPSYLLPTEPGAEDGLTLADIPQFIEASQNRSLPHANGRPHIAELQPQDLLLIKYAALLIIAKSPLGDPALVEEMIEFLEAKKGGFWNKLFNKEKKVKKQGGFAQPALIPD